MHVCLDEDPPCLSIHCTKTVIEQVVRDVVAMAHKIEMQSHTINSPGMPQYFSDDSGQYIYKNSESCQKMYSSLSVIIVFVKLKSYAITSLGLP